jgi:ribosomal-protein-alanine N-acetyltransferase
MTERSLVPRIRRSSRYQVRTTTHDDGPAIWRLLKDANHCYLALEWWTVEDWLGRPTLLLATDRNERLAGVMLAITGDGPIAWLRVIAVSSNECLASLLEASVQAVLAQGLTGLAMLGGEGWIPSQLKSTGFQRVNQVVTLRHRGTWPMHFGPPDLKVRVATPADMNAVLAVDHAAFEPMWWYGREVLHRALNVALCFSVAYLDGECVGYQFSTLRDGRGHIVRLATHPHRQRRGIGGRLLSEAMLALGQAGAEPITVNTQQDNLASLQLYRRFSFDRAGKLWAVWFRSLV